MTLVVHIKRDPFDVRIDRTTPWGNPFVIGRDGDRATVIAKFAKWVTTSDDHKAKWIREHVHELYGKTLGCWCAPQECHGDVLADLAAWAHHMRIISGHVASFWDSYNEFEAAYQELYPDRESNPD